jgi:NCS2 family nucleobase:cation symporter-2
VVFLVGAIIGLAAMRILLEDNPRGALTARDVLVMGCGLFVMVALNIWNRGRLKLFCILIGMAVGYAASDAVGLLSFHDIGIALHQPLFAVPAISQISWRFKWSLVVPFAISGLAAAMNSTAVVTTYQRLTDAEWVRPDMVSIGRGVLGDGIATTIAGLLGTYGVTISSANVGIVAATGVASRAIGFALAALLAITAFQPALIGVLAIMPRPVMAAAMLFTAVFIMLGGVQIISTRVLDGRRTLVIGMGMLAFFVVSVYPDLFAGAPLWAQPLVSSPLVLATLVALSLNLLFRIGIRRTVTMAVDPVAPDQKAVSDFIAQNAGAWGARRDVTDRVEFAVQQTIDAVIGFCEARGPIDLGVSFDEFVIDVRVTYDGAVLEFPPLPPSREDILETEDGHRRLAGFLVRRHADRLETTSRDGRTVLCYHFDH